MRSAAAAFGWELGRRHRWGWVAVAGYLLALATVRLLVFEPGRPVVFEDSRSFAFAVVVPMSIAFMYLLAVFSYGLAGDLAGRRSMYPARLFSLPVTTSALAGYPMLYGTVAMALLWLAGRWLAPWPSGIDVPWIWPAVLASAILAWTQALTWMPYGLSGARVVVSVFVLVMIDVIAIPAVHLGVPERFMVALLAPHLPLAFLVARAGVARARRGDVPDWRGSVARLRRVRAPAPRGAARLPTPARAQLWFEWRRYGRSLPTLVGILLPFETLLLCVFDDTPSVVRATLAAVLLTPPFMAGFVAATVGRSSPEGTDGWELTPFLATRPVTSAALVSAKLVAAALSTLAAWLIVLVAIPIALRLSDTGGIVSGDARRLAELFGAPRTAAIGLLGAAALVVSTWKGLVHGLYVGMSGRAWLVKASVFARLASLTLLVVAAPWVLARRWVIAEIVDALPWILAVLVCGKLAAACGIALRLHAGRLVGDRVLLLGALGWDVAVLALFGWLLWLLPSVLFSAYGLALVAILAIPLARVSASPLALEWNRHR